MTRSQFFYVSTSDILQGLNDYENSQYASIPDSHLTDTALNTVAGHRAFSDAVVARIENKIYYLSGKNYSIELNKEQRKICYNTLAYTLKNINNMLGYLCAQPIYQQIPAAIGTKDGNIIINANNYTTDELIMLYRLISTGYIKLPNELRYASCAPTTLHRILVDLINFENNTHAYYPSAAMQADNYSFSQILSQVLFAVGLGSLFLGIAVYLLAVSTPLILAMLEATLAMVVLSAIFLIPACMGLGVIIQNYCLLNSFNFLADELSIFTSNHIFHFARRPMSGIGIDMNDHKQLLSKLYSIVKPVKGFTQVMLETTKPETLQPVELGFFEKLSNTVSSLFYRPKPNVNVPVYPPTDSAEEPNKTLS